MAGRRQFGRVRRLPSGRWQARYATPEGEQRTAPQTFATKAEASRFLAQIEIDLERGMVVDPRLARTTLREWSERFMTTTVHLRPKTQAAYSSLLRTTIATGASRSPAIWRARRRPSASMSWRETLVRRETGRCAFWQMRTG